VIGSTTTTTATTTTAASAAPSTTTTSSVIGSTTTTTATTTTAASAPSSTTTTSSVIGSTTTTTATTTQTTTTQSLTFTPCRSNIAILIDASNGLNLSQLTSVETFIANSFVTAQWTHFERLAVAEFGGDGEYESTDFGLINSFDEFQQLLTKGIIYYNDVAPSLAGSVYFY
jgi:hypothetical protein